MVRLSQSGSSLKSVFIILATLRLNPLVERSLGLSGQVFFVEEPENNLHPSLLRRLLKFLDAKALESDFHLVLTTHSSAAIDWASRINGTALYHVVKDLDGVVVNHVHEYGSTRRLIDDLDIRASELLQANGVVWVEGPSDRIYIRSWIDHVSSGELVEGQHYAIMFYGGKLLSHLAMNEPEENVGFIEVLRMNRNSALVMDSDKRLLKSGKFRSVINATKQRIISEARTSGSLIWLTDGKEIENYLSDRLLSKLGVKKSPGKHESIPDLLPAHDKISLARSPTETLEDDDLSVLDLKERVTQLATQICGWNGL